MRDWIAVNVTMRTTGRSKGTCMEAIKNYAVVVNLVEYLAFGR